LFEIGSDGACTCPPQRFAKGWKSTAILAAFGPELFVWGRVVVQQTVRSSDELGDEAGRISARAFAQQITATPELGQLFNDGTANLTVPVRLQRHSHRSLRQFSADVYLALRVVARMGTRKPCCERLPCSFVKELSLWSKNAGSPGLTARFCEPSS